MTDVLLKAENLGKSFNAFVAVSRVSFEVRRGSIHALIGPNGAGKTTLFNLLTKVLLPTEGRIIFNGQDVTRLSSASVANLGIVRSFQISAIFPGKTVRENILVALQHKLGVSFHFWRSKSVVDALASEADVILADFGILDAADDLAANLPYGRRRILELATTVARDPKLLLLDEPTQGMAHHDVPKITGLIRKIAATRTVLLVEHNMRVVSSIADTITVLQRGSVISEGPYASVSTNPRVIEAYIGGGAVHAQ